METTWSSKVSKFVFRICKIIVVLLFDSPFLNCGSYIIQFVNWKSNILDQNWNSTVQTFIWGASKSVINSNVIWMYRFFVLFCRGKSAFILCFISIMNAWYVSYTQANVLEKKNDRTAKKKKIVVFSKNYSWIHEYMAIFQTSSQEITWLDMSER